MRAEVATGARTARALWIVAADAAVAALAFALLLGGDERLMIVTALAAVALCSIAADLVVRLAASARSGALARAARVGASVAALAATLWLISTVLGVDTTAIVAVVFAGVALIAQWLVGVMERSGDQPPHPTHPDAAAPLDPAWRAIGGFIGAGLLIFATFDVLAYGRVQDATGAYGPAGVVIGIAVLVGLALLLAGPLVVAAQAGARRERALRERAAHRQAVAAHLHDSVLQTLALIQRSAGDRERVVQLARRQERGLRAWLAGEDESRSASLAAELERAAQQVEDETGVTVESVVGGDLAVDDRTSELVQAAREAMRNAACHGGTGVRVFLDVDPVAATVFVRDAGGGFDLDAVPDQRRGVRDAIIGRMERIGGTVTIESGSSGTEVQLRLPNGRAGR